jgi:hypothetical protein
LSKNSIYENFLQPLLDIRREHASPKEETVLQRLAQFLLIGCVIVWMADCVPIPSHQQRLLTAQQLAESHDWHRLDLNTQPFILTAYLPDQTKKWGAASNRTLTVYIEGDGLAWISNARQSQDPTPIDPVGLKLALHQPDNEAAYLARPCQYTSEADMACDAKFWTSHRFAPEVIAATNQAISTLIEKTGATNLRLVGYSGGGAVAVLVSARRSDVIQLITVAGNLDHVRWSMLHRVSPLTGSLNPADIAADLSRLPQTHFVGGHDHNMPQEIAESYVARQVGGKCTAVISIGSAGHGNGWQEEWASLLQIPPPCVFETK